MHRPKIEDVATLIMVVILIVIAIVKEFVS